MVTTEDPATANASWWVRHAQPLKTIFRILLGVAWLTDGVLKFSSGFVNSFLDSVQTSQANAPSWLSGWFSFWANQASTNATAILALLIWAVPEGFGGPYQSGSGGTDIGTGVIYAIAFLGLILINATYGPSRYSLDYFIEKHFRGWRKIAEFGGAPEPDAAPVVAAGQ